MALRSVVGYVTVTLQKAVFFGALKLPPALQRRIVGKPVVVDGQTLAVEIQLMLKLMELQPVRTQLDMQAGRALLDAQAEMAGGRQKVGSVRSLTAAGLPARLYVPSGAPTFGPLLVFLHGGGFVYGNLDSHDASCRYLAEQSGVRILAVDYRLAPEHPFPAACDDALAAFRWARENASVLGADPERIGVGGDSAGGNLAAGVALAVRDECAFQLLIYPAVSDRHDVGSGEKFASGFFLTAEFMELVGRLYIPEGTDARDPRVSPLFAEVPDGVAPAYVVTAGFDPLRDEGEAYARKLDEAGVKVEVKRFSDQIHGFLNMIGPSRSARAAVDEIVIALRNGL